jgi:S1-C subfamily serine protease
MDLPETSRRPEPRGSSSINTWLIAFLVVLAGILVAQNARTWFPAPLHDPNAAPRAVSARGSLAEDEKSTIEIFRTSSPCVVHITTLTYQSDRMQLNLMEIPKGTGSGFVWDDNGNIVTNFHVVQAAIQEGGGARVALADNSVWTARLVGAEPSKDIAVLKIDAPRDRLKPIPIGESHDLQVGQKVFAIGSPFNLDQTLTSGVISGLGREIQAVTGQAIQDVIQTDAAINPGNSGGPLLDSAGRVIGINTAIFSPSGAYAGIGFAVPVDTVNQIVPELIKSKKADRPGLGIRPWDDGLVQRLRDRGVLDKPGVLVRDILLESASKAGLQGTRSTDDGQVDLGDLIVAIDGEAVESMKDLARIVSAHQPGDEVTVVVEREGKKIELKMTIQALPSMGR